MAGALVLHDTLVSVGSRYPLVIMATPQLSKEARNVVSKRGCIIRDISSLHPEDGVHTLAEADERFGDVWTKLRAFELFEYDRVILLDSDMIVMRNMDELFDLELPQGWIAAVHACACNPHKLPGYPSDWIPENCAHSSVSHPQALTSPPAISERSPRPFHLLNSGLVVLTPSRQTADSVYHYLRTSPLVPTFRFADQDLFAAVFKNKWKPLPWCYNALKTLRVIHKSVWKDAEVRCLHYIMSQKPWHTPPGTVGEYNEVNQWWWDRYHILGKDMAPRDPRGWEMVDAHVARLN